MAKFFIVFLLVTVFSLGSCGIFDRVTDWFDDVLPDCRGEGQSCRGVIRCCNTLQCTWKKGFSLIRAGECVRCVEEGARCNRHEECCGFTDNEGNVKNDYMCYAPDRLSPLNGVCTRAFEDGHECYKDYHCRDNGICHKPARTLKNPFPRGRCNVIVD